MSYRITLGSLVLASLPAFASAQDLPLQTTTGFDLGIQLSDYKYEEDDQGKYFMSLQGRKLGMIGSYTRAYASRWYWSFDGRYASGRSDYDSAGSGKASGTPERYLDARITAGRDFDVHTQLISLYAGLGSRSLVHDWNGRTSVGHWGYRRTSHYLYLPLGITHRFRIDSQSRWSTALEYDHLLEGTQRSYLSDVPGYASDLENRQNKGHGLRLNLAYETLRWSAGVFYHSWDIADSEKATFRLSGGQVFSGYEPHNITTEIGLQLKYRFQ